MSKQKDSLQTIEGPDRVFYETGVLLNAEDFQAEQDYHRGRLARALAYVIGSGTVAGLEVKHELKEEPAPDEENDRGREEQLMIEPGLAIDPLGRMIEVPRPLCIRLGRWYLSQRKQDLREGWHDAGAAWEGSPAGVIADLLIKFVPCERGKTPSFAKGPFDSLDAVTTSRIRDGYEALLIIRKEASPPVPPNPWPDFSKITDEGVRRLAFARGIFDAWKRGAHATTSVFIARMVIAASEATGDGRPERPEGETVEINNRLRPFVFTANAVARWLGIDLTPGTDE